MKEIKLGKKDIYALVDDVDFEELSKHKWYCKRGKQTFYAMNDKIGRMHRLLLKCSKTELVDHKDGNGLNNQRNNLRIATVTQNNWNSRPNRNVKTSTFKGINRSHCKSNPWRVQIMFNNKKIHIGYFPTERSAAMAYDLWAKDLYGDFAWLNFS